MSTPSVIIIGAGLSGLAAGCYARMNGYEATILEQHTAPGGVCAAWKRHGFLFDGGVHFLMGVKPGKSMYRMYSELGIIPNTELTPMSLYAHYVDMADDHSLQLTKDLDRFVSDCKAYSESDGDKIAKLVSGARKLSEIDTGESIGSSPETTGVLDNIQAMWNMRSVLKYFGGEYSKSVGEFAESLENPWLRFVIPLIFMPEVPLWFITMLLGNLETGSIANISKGSLSFAKDIESRYVNLGGEIRYSSAVKEILVEKNRAVGVLLKDDSEMRTDAVIATGDGYHTLVELLGDRYTGSEWKKRFDEWPLITPMMTVSHGIGRYYSDAPRLTIAKLAKPFVAGDTEVANFMVRAFPGDGHFAPEGKTVFITELETDWASWHNLYENDREAYKQAKVKVAEDVLIRLEDLFPGCSSAVEATDIASPTTTYRYTKNRDGAYMGWRPEHRLLMSKIKRTLPGLKRFIMAGQWVVPGGGIPTTLASGREAVRILCKQDGREFSRNDK